jgi:hypothetical protein
MHVHDTQAIRRSIHFIEQKNIAMDIHASAQCCWNCFWSVMTYDCLWCERDMDEVDFRDMCKSWEGEPEMYNA